jgi:hypothetical protein
VSAGIFLLAVCAFGQRAKVPTFEQYRVTELFSGTPVPPRLVTTEERRFRTVIRQGITKGWGVADGVTGDDLNRPGPNFAGHYSIVRWGCGTDCHMIAIVDLQTGQIFAPPFHGTGQGYFNFVAMCPDSVVCPVRDVLSYRLHSRLLTARGCEVSKLTTVKGRQEIQYEQCGMHYYVMTGSGLRLIYRVLEL